MSELRNLLLDCRSALRRADRRFDDDPMRARLDKAINEFVKRDDEDIRDQPGTTTAQQVAYAWQIAIRGVSLTHPELYAKLSRRVTEMLDTKVLTDQAAELIQLESRLESATAAHQDMEKELADLQQALADAVSLSGEDAIGTDIELAHRRIRYLVDGVSLTRHVDPLDGDNGRGKESELRIDIPADMVHDPKDLLTVVQGKRALSKWERSWCVAEALVMTGQSSEQLKELKDRDLAKLVMTTAASTTLMPQLPGF